MRPLLAQTSARSLESPHSLPASPPATSAALQRWLIGLLLTVVAVAVCYLWLDRPLALFAHAHSGERETFARFTHIPDPFIPLACVVFVACGLWVLAGRILTRPMAPAALASISVIVAETTKSGLKYIFGRLWPDTWVQNNPSFIHDDAYGFNFFHGGPGYASFPSGHTTVTCALISVLWILYPQLRALLCARRSGGRGRADRRQLPLPQRRDRRWLPRHLDRLDDGRLWRARQSA